MSAWQIRAVADKLHGIQKYKFDADALYNIADDIESSEDWKRRRIEALEAELVEAKQTIELYREDEGPVMEALSDAVRREQMGLAPLYDSLRDLVESLPVVYA